MPKKDKEKKKTKEKKAEIKNKLKKRSSKKKEICEIVDIVKDGKETEKKVCKTIPVKEKPASKNEIKTENKQLKIIFGIMIALFVGIILIFLIPNLGNKFEYLGLKFEKIKQGETELYYTKLPIIRADGTLINYHLHLINDPRKLEEVVVNVSIKFKKQTATYIVIDSSLNECESDMHSIFTLTNFLSSIGINIKLAEKNSSNKEP